MIKRGVSANSAERSDYFEEKGAEVHNDFRSRQIIDAALAKKFDAIKFNEADANPTFEFHHPGESTEAKSDQGWIKLNDIEAQDKLTTFLTKYNIKVEFDSKSGKISAQSGNFQIDAVDRL